MKNLRYIENEVPVRNYTAGRKKVEKLKGYDKIKSCPQFLPLVIRIMSKLNAFEKDKYGDITYQYDFDRQWVQLEKILKDIRSDQKIINTYIWNIPFRKQSQVGLNYLLFLAHKDNKSLKHEDLITLKSIKRNNGDSVICSIDVFRLFQYYVSNEVDEYLELQEFIQSTGNFY